MPPADPMYCPLVADVLCDPPDRAADLASPRPLLVRSPPPPPPSGFLSRASWYPPPERDGSVLEASTLLKIPEDLSATNELTPNCSSSSPPYRTMTPTVV